MLRDSKYDERDAGFPGALVLSFLSRNNPSVMMEDSGLSSLRINVTAYSNGQPSVIGHR